MDNEGRQFSTDELAHVTNVTRRTIQRWSSSGKIGAPYRTPGGRPYYTSAHVLEILPHLDEAGLVRLIESRMSSFQPQASEGPEDTNITE